ncbi:DNA oxidative demethylase ALKBH2 [Linum perenne]
MSFKQKTLIQQPTTNPDPLTSGDEATSTAAKKQTIDLGNGSEIVYFPRFLPFDASSKFFDYLDTRIPWTRPTVRVFGRSCLQVHKALPGSRFNSLLLNRYKGGNDNVGWHADDEKLYGPTPEIASVSFGCEREFLMKKRPSKSSKEHVKPEDEPVKKRLKKSENGDDHRSFRLKHGSLLVMRGYTQRDWLHSVPKRAKVEATRINLTFRLVL